MLAQSPHGSTFAIDCAKCHNSEDWSFNTKSNTFNHDSTTFPLIGQHNDLDCRSCHTSLEFKQVSSECVSCHVDMHNQTVGTDCARCHTPTSWIVENVTDLHEKVAFPLMGVHATVNCNECHQGETNVRFNPTGVECINCHRSDYATAVSPDHVKNGFSMDCASCHSITTTDWNTDIVDHSFFPLEQGHNIQDCAACHANGEYSAASPLCISCHQTDFNTTTNPKHTSAGFSTNCMECHTLSPGWKPVDFSTHDGQFFPIYSGKHKGVWNDCIDCHTNSDDYTQFTCVSCHINPETDDLHNGVSGYNYQDNACLSCHPTGGADMAFDHNATNFPLTGAHIGVDCISCHANGYEGTSTACVDCHTADFNQTLNPNHTALGISNDCASCHSTTPGWSPATFANHNDYYALNGAHAMIANDCASCHNGDFNNTPNTCVGCHNGDFTQTTDPSHVIGQFSTDCASCHSESAWMPSTFNHDGLYFPIYSGKHFGQWSQCIDCHTNTNDYSQFTCISCHTNPETDIKHSVVTNYTYSDHACLACHPTGDADATFDHNTTNFPLTGAHTNVDCISCHMNGYQGTSTACVDCHTTDFNQALNPNHIALGISNDCASCHSTMPSWSPATFSMHNDYYMLNGAHATIANDCAACHNGNYNNTPNTCVACHTSDYNSTTDPNHLVLQFPDDCASCHSENAWIPSTFNHDGLYFPIYSGKHQGQWDQCVDCHTTAGDYTQFTCITCHMNPQTDTEHTGVGGYVYNSPACLACHPSGDADMVFDHNTTSFPLTGAHIGADCISCHAAGYQGTSTLCVDCHTTDFNQALNPNHIALGISNDCATCHTTAAGWSPATFAVHNNYYMLNGAHAAIANDCAACHNGNYNNTPNTCVACHTSDYNSTTDPNHVALQFPNDCASCHSENAWSPSTFDHNAVYPFVGAHIAIANDCVACHNGNYNNTPNTCIGCHADDFNGTVDPDHEAGMFPTECIGCHSQNAWTPSNLNHDIFYPLTGAHATIEENCTACHANGYNNTPNTCVGCHNNDFTAALNPNHIALGISNDCASCHTTMSGWSPASFAIHDNYYMISGAHLAIANDCVACHNGNYNNTPNTCIGCHTSDFNGTTDPNHMAAQFPTDCTTCHSQDVWSPSTFDHNVIYPFVGAHIAIADNCVACHNGNYNNTPNTCIGCHTDDFNATVDPDHEAGMFPTECIGCHSQNAWTPTSFNHSIFYPLTGAHATIADNCVACHANGYNNTPNTCVGCHNNDYAAALNPNHVALGISNDCASCHTTAPGWSPASFANHDDYYLISGAHLALANDCVACHNGNYNNTPNTCVGCHTTDYNATTDPNHVTAQFPTDCTTCHSQDAWTPSTFDHNAVYPFVGAHIAIADNCVACHNGNYNNTPNTCIGCHTTDFNATTNPDHEAGMFPTDCISCHSQSAWTPATFDHSQFYPLTGAHATIANDCVSCHNGDYNNTPTTCVGCHQSDYNGSLNPNHGTLGISTDCVSCHTTAPGWAPASFAVHDNYYVIAGAHLAIVNDCAACHNGNYNNTPNTCIGCHTADYNGTTNPNHVTAQFPTDCTTCHSQSAWTPSTFDHNNVYPLTGAHATIATNCAACHMGDYNNTPNTCVGCHNSDYTGTQNPNHLAIGISNDCVSCHTTDPGWMPALFPIHNNYYVLAGAHVSLDCASCHNGNYNNTPNTCFGCHSADYNGANNPNHITAQFPTDCTVCHSQTAWVPSTFDHDDLYFPIYSGKHQGEWDQCVECHTTPNNYTLFSCIDCHEHDNQNEVDNDHEDVNGYQYNSNACYSCHPDGFD